MCFEWLLGFALLCLRFADPVTGAEQPPPYRNHQDLTFYLDAAGKKHSVKTPADWSIRRRHILLGMQAAMGPLPGAEKRVPLDAKVLEEVKVGPLVRRKLTFQSEPGVRVPAY